ncbi:MAG: 6-phosphogluconolactonase [Candidatus Limnocylindrales bacterium]
MTDRPIPQGVPLLPDQVDRPDRGDPELVILPSVDAVAAAATDRIVAALEASVRERGLAHFATTGGSSPLGIYRRLAAPPLRDRLPWGRIHVWWGDDRFVPRDHPESNVLSFDSALLRTEAQARMPRAGADTSRALGRQRLDDAPDQQVAPIPPANIHPFPTALAIAEGHDTAWCARTYADELARYLPVDGAGWPVFDLAIVGVGDDGHVLSCFPGSAALGSPAWALGIPAPKHIEPHLPRVTLNPAILDAARTLLAITSGPSKAEALAGVFGPTRDERRWPVQRTRRAGATWLIDEAAAARLPGRG